MAKSRNHNCGLDRGPDVLKITMNGIDHLLNYPVIFVV